jgi:hypothetical protein
MPRWADSAWSFWRSMLRATRPETSTAPRGARTRESGRWRSPGLQVAAQGDHVREVDADPEPGPEIPGVFRHTALDLEAAADRTRGLGDLGQRHPASARRSTAVAADRRVDQLVLNGRKLAIQGRARLRALIGQVDRQDRGELLMHFAMLFAGASLGGAS